MAGLTNNPIELLIALNVNDKTSKQNITTYLNNLKTQLKDLDVINLTVKNNPANKRTFFRTKQEIEDLKKVASTFGTQIDRILHDKKRKSKIFGGLKDEVIDSLKTVRQLEEYLKSQNMKYTIDYKINRKGIEEVRKVITQVKNEFGELEKITIVPAFSKKKGAHFKQTVSSVTNDDVSILNNYNKAFDNLNDKITKFERTGVLHESTINSFRENLKNIGNETIPTTQKIEKLQTLLSYLNKEFNATSHMNKMKDAMEQASRSVENLNSKLEKMRNTYKRQFSNSDFTNEAKDIQNAIAKLPKADFGNDREVKQYNNELAKIETRITSLNSKVVQSARSSMTLLNSFKTALEKFPIWMASTTIFFGVTRTAREFMSIIVDIDSKMTDLAKVMSDDTNFEALFDRATESAERFGQSISQVLDSYTEFARQGYKADELGLLADAGLVASNVGDITAQKASEYMTASLIQWKKDASEAMGIIDSWNEISNNYATTVEKLAAGQSRAGSVAKAMGLEFDQLNAIVGTV